MLTVICEICKYGGKYIVFTLQSSKGNNMLKSDRRRYSRYDSKQEISYIVHPTNSKQLYTGIIVNMSCAGMCLNVANHLSLGQEITVTQKNQYYVKGTVIWCIEMGESLHPYKIGLKFAFKIKE
jgi:c-di-GMP-binding flagellar brake protein YcgR